MTARPELYAPFRPRRARVVALTLGAVSLVALGLLGALLPQVTGFDTGVVDQLSVAGLGVAIAAFCWRQATVRAVPDPEGVTVRNLFLSRRVEWEEVVSVRFGQGRPWAQLDLTSGDTLAVMGIQRADGAFADGEARRLATLVVLHEGRP